MKVSGADDDYKGLAGKKIRLTKKINKLDREKSCKIFIQCLPWHYYGNDNLEELWAGTCRRCNKLGKSFALRSIFDAYGIVKCITAPA